MSKLYVNYMSKLYCDDCLNVLKDIPDNSIDLIVTDPPYLIPTINGGGTVNNIKKLNKFLNNLTQNTDITQSYDIPLFNTEFIRVMKDINIYIWCNKAQILDYLKFYVDGHGCKYDILTYHKENALPTYSNKYLTDTEYCLYFHKGGNKCSPQNYQDAKTYWNYKINQADTKYGHPTVKPLFMIKQLVRNSSKEGQLVLDPFMGSGTTGVACKELNRNFIGIEIDETYFNIAEKRIKADFNKKLF